MEIPGGGCLMARKSLRERNEKKLNLLGGISTFLFKIGNCRCLISNLRKREF